MFIYKVKKISVKISSENYSFGLSKVKYLIGDNYNLKRSLIMAIRKEFNKETNSEFSYENNTDSNLLINDEKINHRSMKYYDVNDFYDFTDELKLKSSSIVLSFLANTFKNIEYSDTLSTINILINDLSKEMTEFLNQNSKINDLNIKIDEINLKNIFKQLSVNLERDNLELNQFDYDYNNKIITQLKMIESIASTSYEFKHIVILDIPLVTSQIINFIYNIKETNLIILVNIPQKTISGVSLKDILSINNKFIDLMDEISIYNNIMLELESHISLEDLSILLDNYFNKGQISKLNLDQII